MREKKNVDVKISFSSLYTYTYIVSITYK